MIKTAKMKHAIADDSNLRRKDQTADGLTMLMIISIMMSMSIQLVLAFSTQRTIDVMNFNYVWATTPIKNIFHLYDIGSIDYPPVIPLLLRCLRFLLLRFPSSTSVFFLMKIVPVIFNSALGVLIYFIVKSNSETSDFCKAIPVVIGFFSPALLFNSAIWGQFDSLLVILLISCFYLLFSDRPFWAAILFSVGCLTKLQFCYFVFPFFGVAFIFYSRKKSVRMFFLSLLVGIIGWLPFVIVSGVSLPPRIYFGGSQKYPFFNVNAFNIFGIFQSVGGDVNRHSVIFGLHGGPYNILVILVSSVLCISLLLLLKTKKGFIFDSQVKSTISLIVAVYINSIFIFSTQQHERYQIPILAMLLLVISIGNRIKDNWIISGFILIIFLNESVVYYSDLLREVSDQYYRYSFSFLSAINVVFSLFFFLYVLKNVLSIGVGMHAEENLETEKAL